MLRHFISVVSLLTLLMRKGQFISPAVISSPSLPFDTSWPCLTSSQPWKLERGDVGDISRIYFPPCSLTLNSTFILTLWHVVGHISMPGYCLPTMFLTSTCYPGEISPYCLAFCGDQVFEVGDLFLEETHYHLPGQSECA